MDRQALDPAQSVVSDTRAALVIANSRFEDARLRQLIAPPQDAEALANVLGNAAIGGFQVQTLLDEPSHRVSREIETFFADRNRDDLLLVYFSGHGIKDNDGQLHFAAMDTRLDRLRSTAVSANLVNEVMLNSRSRRQVLLLDCCYSGAFARGMLTKADRQIGTGERFKGQGRVVLTASDAMQYSFEGEAIGGEGVRSIFTRTLVRGLETGEADPNGDGYISLDNLYDYIYERVVAETPEQRPAKWTFGLEGNIVVARNPRPVVKPAELPAELRQAVESSLASVREAVVRELERLLRGSHRGLSIAAREALMHLMEDDSRRVSTAASVTLAALESAKGTPESPAPTDRHAQAERSAEHGTDDTAETGTLSRVRAEPEGKAQGKPGPAAPHTKNVLRGKPISARRRNAVPQDVPGQGLESLYQAPGEVLPTSIVSRVEERPTVLLPTLLTAMSCLIPWLISRVMLYSQTFAVKEMLNGVGTGLVLGLVLPRILRLTRSWRCATTIAATWGIGAFTSVFIAFSISFELPVRVFAQVLLGAIGGCGTAYALVRAGFPMQRKDAVIVASGWGVASGLSSFVVWTVAIPMFSFVGGQAVGAVITGAVGGGVMFWRLGRERNPN